MKLGSLFDGSGGFPLAGTICGITPVWASEIEPYPISVTKARFPEMKHLGSITQINGAEIEPVDVITFGSPCQDLSVAGKHKGIHEGERSNLFFEAIRIIHEMREATDHRYPRYAVWENVPGAFSSNKGHDFRAVLQAFCDEADQGLHVPLPQKGKWQHAGCVVGDGFSVAWRQYDAQFWGVPQRRKRIYLIADFGSERAGEILFEREGVCWNSETSGEARERNTENVERCAGGSGEIVWGYCLNARRPSLDVSQNFANTITESDFKGAQAVVGAFMGGQGSKAGGIAFNQSVTPTIKSVVSGSNSVPDVVYAIDQQGGKGCANYAKNVMPTLCSDSHGTPHAVAIDCRNLKSNNELSGTLQAKPNGGYSLNYQNPIVYSSSSHGCLSEGIGTIGTGTRAVHEMVAVYDTTQITSPSNYSKPKPGDPCHPLAEQQHPPLAVYPERTGALCANSHPGSYTGQDAFNDMLPVIHSEKPPSKYIVRRLTPLECCRLQGFPDGWGDTDVFPDWTDEDCHFWLNVRNTHAAINGKPVKEYTKKQMVTWYNKLHSDAAEYKMWGNGIALPCAIDVLSRLERN
ncbi:MAG: DNA cytosine methyltransferase [Bacteroidaceae bacterium]|nr:DNA cytosine methyltransferase [Bacteroidaceae bacterium]